MVTGRLAKHCCGEHCKTSLFGGEGGGRASPWSPGFGGLLHTHRHTHSCARELGSCCRWWKVSIGWFVGHTYVLGWSERWPWLTTSFNTFATWSLQSWQAVPPSCCVPVTWCDSWQGQQRDLVFPAPLSHGVQGSATLHITFHQLLGPQFFRAALQGPVVWNRNVFSVLHRVPRFWLAAVWYLHLYLPVLCALALGRGFTPLYPSWLSRDLHWAPAFPWLWNIESWKDHQGVPSHL